MSQAGPFAPVIRPRCSLLRTVARSSFGVDLRSLAMFRILLGGLLLVDLLNRTRSLTAHYTDQGIVPRSVRISMYDAGDIASEASYWWSLHLMNGQWWFQALLFAIATVAAVCLVVGFRTRAATVVSWLLLISLHSRMPDILNGGDSLLALLLFWSLFLPLGARASIDSHKLGVPLADEPDGRYLSVATVALILQIVSVYLVNAIVKMGSEWTTDFTAVHYALNFDLYATATGREIAQYPGLLQWFTFGAYYLEWIGPLVALCPVANRWCRMLAIFAFGCFHVGSVVCLELGLFPYICLVAWLVLLPEEFWNVTERISRPLSRRAEPLAAWVSRVAQRFAPWGRSPRLKLSGVARGFVTVALLYLVALNVRHVVEVCFREEPLPLESLAWWEIPGALGRLDQRWSMFAPSPPTDDGWFVIAGTLRNGERVDLWQPGRPLSFAKPSLVSQQYDDHRWRKYFASLRIEFDRDQAGALSEWTRRRWNREQAAGDSQREIVLLACYFVLETTPPPGAPTIPLETTLLWDIDYGEPEATNAAPIALPRNDPPQPSSRPRE